MRQGADSGAVREQAGEVAPVAPAPPSARGGPADAATHSDAAWDESRPEASVTTASTLAPAHGEDPRLLLMRQVLTSRTFSKATRLSQFLEFVCRRAIEGQSAEINEQQIGVHVFGRSPAYNATDDSIVRSQARLLRQRLEEFFEHECPGCPTIVRIPKGGYVPVFETRSQGKQDSQHSQTATKPVPLLGAQLEALHLPTTRESEETHPEASTGTRHLLFWGALAIVGLAVAVAAVLLLGRSTRLPGLWSSIFDAGRPVIIVPSDDGLVLSEELRRAPVTLDAYLSGSYLREEQGPASGEPGNGHPPVQSGGGGSAQGTASWLASHQYTSTADLSLAMRLNRLPEAASASVETRYARALHLEDLKTRNVILIGGIGANPWVGLFTHLLHFDVNYDWQRQQGYVIDKQPQPGEPVEYREQTGESGASSYGVLAYLPGVGGSGSALLFEGSGMAGTEAAADFPFGDSFAAFLGKLGRTPEGKLPYFEVLLATRSLGGDAPAPQVVAWHRIHP